MSSACGPSQSCLRHPPPWMGYAGRNSETESAHPEELGKDARPPSTVMSGLLYRFTDATAGKIFVRDASAFSIFCVYGKNEALTLLRVSLRFSLYGFARITKE